MDEKTLRKIKERLGSDIAARQAHLAKQNARYERQVLVCGGSGCSSGNSKKIYNEFAREIKEKSLIGKVNLVMTGCFGLCALGPVVIIYPEGSFYANVKLEHVEEIVDGHLVGGKPVKQLLYKETVNENGEITPLADTDFYRKQSRLTLRNCGVIDPENIEEYIARDGYFALLKALNMPRGKIIEEVSDSGLRGRGGAGFLTGRKWKFTYDAQSDVKYVACNADEGDPGAFMDRSVLEGDPHVVLEAMSIAAYAVGANHGFIYVRAEYPVAVHRLQVAIKQSREAGLLGKNILNKNFDFDIEIRLGAGAFVCGEETALMTSIEGKRGEPRPRPPFPAVKGLRGKPTLLNNVETYANIPQIILNGSKWFSSVGTEKSKGTKVFALGGKIHNTGLVEVPMGTSLREIVYEIGGGIPQGKAFKAAQTGGPSGGCIPAELIDTEIDYESLQSIGSMMGSGGLIVMDEDNCMVDIAKFFLEFTVDESCGKCTPCRVGTKRLYEMLCKITDGNATLEDLDKMEELCHYIQDNSLCGLGQSAPNPVLSTLKYYRKEYEAHIVDKVCPAGVCKSLIRYEIDPDKCIGCNLCARNCSANAIRGTVKKPHVIDPEACIKCGICETVCRFKAIKKVGGKK